MQLSNVAWGDVPSWVGAVTTLGALIAAALAVLPAWKLLRLEFSRDQISAADRQDAAAANRRAQAAQIVVWMDQEPSVTGLAPFRVMYSNTSGLPVYDVLVSLRAARLDGGVTYRLLAPTAQPAELPDASGRIDHHLTGDEQAMKETLLSWMSRGDAGPIKAAKLGEPFKEIGQLSPVGVEMSFTDATGTRWRRSGWGPLTEIGPAEDLPRGSVLG